MSYAKMAAQCGLARQTIRYRIVSMAWSPERAMTVPLMTRRRMGHICAVFDADPTLTSYEIAERLGLDDSYVRAALRKAGRKLIRTRGQKKWNRAFIQTSVSPTT